MMNIESVRASLASRLTTGFDFYERRPGKHQLIIPIHHEDGDMVDIYLTESPKGDGWARICDFGMALMRLSYTYDINTDARRRIFDSILINNGVENDDGNLYLDARLDALYEGVMQFAGCVQKVCNMRFWSREAVRSAFYDDLKTYIISDLERFSPTPEFAPIQNSPVSVDWALSHNNRSFYVFGVQNNMKARDVTIALLECRNAHMPFISLVVHENMEDLGRKESFYLTKNADRQYPALVDFRESAPADIARFAGAFNGASAAKSA